MKVMIFLVSTCIFSTSKKRSWTDIDLYKNETKHIKYDLNTEDSKKTHCLTTKTTANSNSTNHLVGSNNIENLSLIKNNREDSCVKDSDPNINKSDSTQRNFFLQSKTSYNIKTNSHPCFTSSTVDNLDNFGNNQTLNSNYSQSTIKNSLDFINNQKPLYHNTFLQPTYNNTSINNNSNSNTSSNQSYLPHSTNNNLLNYFRGQNELTYQSQPQILGNYSPINSYSVENNFTNQSYLNYTAFNNVKSPYFRSTQLSDRNHFSFPRNNPYKQLEDYFKETDEYLKQKNKKKASHNDN